MKRLAANLRKNKKHADLQLKAMTWSFRTEISKFTQINDKRYYFSNGIVSQPFCYLYLLETVQFKRDKKEKIEAFLQREKDKLIQMGKFAVGKNTQISIYRSIL